MTQHVSVPLPEDYIDALRFAVAYTFHALRMVDEAGGGIQDATKIAALHDMWHQASDAAIVGIDVTFLVDDEPDLDQPGPSTPQEMAFDDFVRHMASTLGIKILTPRGVFSPDEA